MVPARDRRLQPGQTDCQMAGPLGHGGAHVSQAQPAKLRCTARRACVPHSCRTCTPWPSKNSMRRLETRRGWGQGINGWMFGAGDPGPANRGEGLMQRVCSTAARAEGGAAGLGAAAKASS
jgi:hypothetical protein